MGTLAWRLSNLHPSLNTPYGLPKQAPLIQDSSPDLSREIPFLKVDTCKAQKYLKQNPTITICNFYIMSERNHIDFDLEKLFTELNVC